MKGSVCSIWNERILVVVLLAVPMPLFGQLHDQVHPLKGIPVNGTITKMSSRHIVIKPSAGPERTLTVDEIRKINYADDPPELNRARQYVVERRYKEAIVDLDNVNQNSIKQEFIKQDMQFYRALAASKLALRGEGSLLEAARAMVTFADNAANKENYHYFEATETVGDLAYALGRLDTAEQRYTELLSAPGTDVKVRAKVRVGECQLGQGKHAEALSTFNEVIDADLMGYEHGDEQKMFAKVGKAVCQSALGKNDEAVQMLEDIIKTGDPKNMALFGRAYNGLGSCHRQAGRNKDALLAYLHTDILFYGDPDTHAEALYNLGKLWQEEKRPDRAVRAINLLKSQYGGSLWAQKQ